MNRLANILMITVFRWICPRYIGRYLKYLGWLRYAVANLHHYIQAIQKILIGIIHLIGGRQQKNKKEFQAEIVIKT